MTSYRLTYTDDYQGSLEISCRGNDVLANAILNRGDAFTAKEREALGLIGLIPNNTHTLEEQVECRYKQFKEAPGDLAKFLNLSHLQESNEVLFYALVSKYAEEMLPIIYTPTIGKAVETFSTEFRQPRGLFVSYPDRDKMDKIIQETVRDIDLAICTDGEGVLGIGDWGVGGIDIAIGKLSVYTVCGGVNPFRCLPIQLDVGTNNEALLNNPNYMGWRHERVTGQDYDDFIDCFVTALVKKFPNIYLHWEDFGRENARRNLLRYRDKMATFNDDMQGTGATALAVVLSALQAINGDISKQKIAFLGAGTAGCGIADQIVSAMLQNGLSEQQAYDQVWLVDRDGLLLEDSANTVFFQKPYLKKRDQVSSWTLKNPDRIDLIDVIKNYQPTILIGCSTVKGAFNEEIVKAMASYCEHPIILPLSNPTDHCEADPQDLINWTHNKVLTAAGSPFQPAVYKGNTKRISQCNNAFMFPGLGRGVILSQAKRVTDGMIWAACDALSKCSPVNQDIHAPLLPDIVLSNHVSDHLALAVAKQAMKEGVAQIDTNIDLAVSLKQQKWAPHYYPIKVV